MRYVHKATAVTEADRLSLEALVAAPKDEDAENVPHGAFLSPEFPLRAFDLVKVISSVNLVGLHILVNLSEGQTILFHRYHISISLIDRYSGIIKLRITFLKHHGFLELQDFYLKEVTPYLETEFRILRRDSLLNVVICVCILL